MAQKSLYDLTLNISANSAELSKGLAKANTSIGSAGKSASAFGKLMDNTFKKAANAIDSVIPGFSTFASGIGSAGKAVTGLSKTFNVLKIAIASTGIGLLVVALGTLVSYFKNTEAGGDKFAEVMGKIKGIIGEVLQRVNLLGEAVFKLLKGDFKGAAESAKAAFTDLGKAIKEAGQAGLEAAQRRDALEDKEIAFITKQQELINKIEKAREVYNNEESSVLDKQKAIADALAAQTELYNTKKFLAQENLDILKLENTTKERTNVRIKEEQEALANVLAIDAERSKELSTLYKLQKRISGQAEKEVDEKAELLLAERKLAELKPVTGSTSQIAMPSLTPMLDTTSLAEVAPNAATAADALAKLFANVQSFNAIPNPFGFLTNSLDTLTSKLSEGAQSFREYGKSILSTIKNIISGFLAEAVASMISTAIKSSAALGPLALIAAPVLAAAGAGIVKTAFNSLIPGFATGTNYAPGGLSLVGERGPELVNLPRGAQVHSNRLSQSMMGGGTVVFEIEGTKLVGILGKQNKIYAAY